MKRSKLYRHWSSLKSEHTSRGEAREAESESKRLAYEDVIRAHEAKSESKQKACDEAIIALKAESESKRKAYEEAIIALKAESKSKRQEYEDAIIALEAESMSKRKACEEAQEAESELEQKAYKDAIQTHNIHIKYTQGLLSKAETKYTSYRWATKLREKNALLHFEGLVRSEREEIILLKCQLEAQQLQYDQDMESQRMTHLGEMETQVQSEREARESQRKAHLEEQLKSIEDAEREVCVSQKHLCDLEAQLKCIQESERGARETQQKAQSELDFERKAHHGALIEADHNTQTALQSERSANSLRVEACRTHFQSLLKTERLVHTEYDAKCLATFQTFLKDEREVRYETQRLLDLEREKRMKCERTLETLAETYKVREREFENDLLERVKARLTLHIFNLNARGSQTQDSLDFMRVIKVD
jgi:hypothetical protein